jgi:hypothetical protein
LAGVKHIFAAEAGDLVQIDIARQQYLEGGLPE